MGPPTNYFQEEGVTENSCPANDLSLVCQWFWSCCRAKLTPEPAQQGGGRAKHGRQQKHVYTTLPEQVPNPHPAHTLPGQTTPSPLPTPPSKGERRQLTEKPHPEGKGAATMLTLKMKKSSMNMAPKGRIPAIRILKSRARGKTRGYYRERAGSVRARLGVFHLLHATTSNK